MLDCSVAEAYIAGMQQTSDNRMPFMKMHGLGNDFVVFDARERDVNVTASLAQALGNRHTGVGFDQLAVMTKGETDLHLTFYNADGSLSAACGNATRCIARHVMDERGVTELTLTTERGVLTAIDRGAGMTAVNMGHPRLAWDEIPLASQVDTISLPIDGAPTATSMGNPHCTYFVDDLSVVDVPMLGARTETDPLFPERTNVQVAQITGPDRIRMRVWERGVGMTLASGSSSCAVAVAAARRGLATRSVHIDLDGGSLAVEWAEDGVWMTGPTSHVFTGYLTQSFLDSLQ